MAFTAQPLRVDWSGIGDAGASLGDVIAKVGERRKEEADLTKTLRKLLPQLGLDDESVQVAGLPELKGMLQGHQLNQKMMQDKAVMDAHLAQQDHWKTQSEMARKEAEQRQRDIEAFKSVSESYGPDTPESYWDKIIRSGMSPDAALKTAKAWEAFNDRGAAARDSKISKGRFGTVLNPLTNKPFENVFVDLDTGLSIHLQRGEATAGNVWKPVVDEKGKPIPNQWFDPQTGKTHSSSENELQTMMRNKEDAATPPASNARPFNFDDFSKTPIGQFYLRNKSR